MRPYMRLEVIYSNTVQGACARPERPNTWDTRKEMREARRSHRETHRRRTSRS